MKLILFIVFIFAFIFSSRFRCICLHPFLTVFYVIKDTYKYIRYRRWREFKKYGTLNIYTGLFGKGKTLVLTKSARKIYKKFNNKKVYDFVAKCWKTQQIHIVSNVHINDVPYIKLHQLNDMLTYATDEYNDGVSIWLFLVDEMSTQINSRSFKTNFSTELLNILLTCRHYRFCIFGTAQRFQHVDALVRGVTQTSRECNKIWRLAKVSYYDAWKIENVSDITKIKPQRTTCLFIKDSDYNAYDTSAVVDNFKDAFERGDVLSDKEILENMALNQDYSASKFNYKWRFKRKL